MPDSDEAFNTPEDPEPMFDLAELTGEEAPQEDDEFQMTWEIEGPPKPPNPFCEAR